MKKLVIAFGVGTPWVLLAVVLLRGNFGGPLVPGAIPQSALATAALQDQIPATTAASEVSAREIKPVVSAMSGIALRPMVENDTHATAVSAAQEVVPGASDAEKFAAACAGTNLTAALDWLATLPEGKSKTVASMVVAYEAARTDPVTALRLASPLPASRERDELLAHSVSQWAQTDTEAATAWVASVPDAALREHLLAGVAVALAGKDGAAAATLAGTVLSAGPVQDRTAVSIVEVWSQTAPQAAASWVLQFPNALRVAAVRSLILIWTLRDAAAAADWLNALPVGPDHDAAQAAYTQAIAAL